VRKPTGPIVALAARLLREKWELRREVIRLRGHVAGLQEIADELEAQRDREREARMDLERLHGWLGSEAT
jgi:hypothetical protein